MVTLLVILGLLLSYWLYRIASTVRAVNARQRYILAGCTGYPISPSSRRPATAFPSVLSAVPLRYGKGRAAERSLVCLS